jgi:hypothetical protein
MRGIAEGLCIPCDERSAALALKPLLLQCGIMHVWRLIRQRPERFIMTTIVLRVATYRAPGQRRSPALILAAFERLVSRRRARRTMRRLRRNAAMVGFNELSVCGLRHIDLESSGRLPL